MSEVDDDKKPLPPDSVHGRAIQQSQQLSKLIDNKWSEVQMLTEAFRVKKLEKRALFGFIGSLSNTLFGTATEKQVKQLEKKVNWAGRQAELGAFERGDLYAKFFLKFFHLI